jgi:pimeloyl-ACP methyl ester carboxylesterase
MKYIYLHGFASSPASRKAQFFAAKLRAEGCAVEIPALESEGFRNLTITGQLNVIEKAAAGEKAVRLIGSSMGGYLAALYASREARVDRVVMLAPAFGFAERWVDRLGEGKMRQWREEGFLEMFHYAGGQPEAVGYGLIEDGLRYPAEPAVHQPAQIFHGVQDDVVPVAFSRQYVARHAHVQLTELDSGHELTDVMDEIWTLSRDFLLG